MPGAGDQRSGPRTVVRVDRADDLAGLTAVLAFSGDSAQTVAVGRRVVCTEQPLGMKEAHVGDESALEEFRAALVRLRDEANLPRIKAERAAPSEGEEQESIDLRAGSSPVDDRLRDEIAAEVSRQLRELMQEGLQDLVADAVAAVVATAVEAELDRVTGP